ncbi:MAG: S1 family peptidase [Planctomycetota bacterium]|jgi:hypothetical protein
MGSRLILCFTILAALALLAPAADAGTIRHDRAPVLYTNLASQPFADPVGKMTIGGSLCSGTYIGQAGGAHWVLTAAHCVAGATPGMITFDLSNSGGGVHGASQIIVHPGWTGSLLGGNDLALVRLSSAPTVAPAPYANGGLFGVDAELGLVGVHAGYGRWGTGLTGAIFPAGTERAGTNVIDVEGSALIPLFGGGVDTILADDFDNPSGLDVNPFGSPFPTNLEIQIAPGDSGGPLFALFGGLPWLVGVHSFFGQIDGSLNADYGDIGGSTRVSAFAGWIYQQTRIPPARVPEPGMLTLLAFGVGGLVVRRRRRRAG